MEKMPLDGDTGMALPIDSVAGDRTTQESQVEANLVSAPGYGMDFQQGMGCERLQCSIFTDCLAALSRRDDRHFAAFPDVTSYGRFDPSCRCRRSAVHQSQVRFLNLVLAKLILEPAMGAIVFCQQDQMVSGFGESFGGAIVPAFGGDIGLDADNRLDL